MDAFPAGTVLTYLVTILILDDFSGARVFLLIY